MTPFFDIALALVGTASTLAAFGGKTTEDEDEDNPRPLFKRITVRGKVSLACLALTLSLGLVKILQTNVEDRQKTELNEAIKKKEAAEKGKEAAEANARQGAVQEKLTESIAKADGLAERLTETKTTLADVRRTQRIEHDDMNDLNAAALVTSFANSNQNVKAAWIYLPLTKQADRASSITGALFPTFNQPVCNDLVGLSLDIILHSGGGYESTFYERSDLALSHRDFIGGMQHTDELQTFEDIFRDEEANTLMTFLHQRNSNNQIYSAGFRASKGHLIPAAQLYASFTKPGDGGIALVADWPRVFKNRQSYEELKSRYPDILTDRWSGDPERSVEYSSAQGHPFPKACKDRIRSYFKSSFDKAVVFAVVDQAPYELMMFSLKALPVKISDESVIMPFGLAATPSFSLVSEEQLTKFNEVWENWP